MPTDTTVDAYRDSSDVTQAESQAAIADSLLSDGNITGHLIGGEFVPRPEPTSEELAGIASREELQEYGALPQDPEQEQEEPEQWQAEQEPAEPGTVESLVQEYELADPELAQTFAGEFCEALGGPDLMAQVNPEALGSVMANTAVSIGALFDNSGGDISKVDPIPPDQAQAWANDLITSFGGDPRLIEVEGGVDAPLLANTVLSATWNLLNTYQAMGTTDVRKLNSPEQAVAFWTNWQKAFGIDTPVDTRQAVAVSDAAARYILGMLGRITPQQQAERTQTRTRQRVARGSNEDIFSADVLQQIRQERAISDEEREAPKQQRQQPAPRRQSRAAKNPLTELFGEDVMEAWSSRML